MQPIIMQDWVTIQGTSSSTTVIMSEADWLLTAPYQDITFYLDVREFTPTSGGSIPKMRYETAPNRDDSLFYRMGTEFEVAMGCPSSQVKTYYAETADAPVSHWARWKVTGPSASWSITFRIMVSANSIH